MTLGKRISQYRKGLGISQEELGARLGVSRQAVSKWETDAAAPDMANLIALAREFGVSVAELTETPEQRPEPAAAPASLPESPGAPRRVWLWLPLALLFVVLISGILWLSRENTRDVIDTPPPDTQLPETEFRLQWRVYAGSGSHPREFLALGIQETPFPFGTTSLELSAPEEVYDADFSGMTRHRAPCGGVTIEYDHIEDQDGTRDSIVSLSTLQSSYATPRGIVPGETEDDLLLVYDSLVYCLKEEDGYTLVPHDYYYVYSAFEEDLGWAAIFFYMQDGMVAGIRMEALGELGDFYAPDNVSRFSMKDGEPDFSQRQEPEREERGETWQVYHAWNQLVTNDNLSAEEIYTYHWTIFNGLADLNWQELGQLGGTEYPQQTMEALLSWLLEQAPYSEREILSLQMGVQSNLDGWLTESYANLLSTAFFGAPVEFAKKLATDTLEDTMYEVIHLTAYDAEWHPVELEAALETLDNALNGGQFTEAEVGWARLLRLYLITPIDERNELPKTPAELQ